MQTTVKEEGGTFINLVCKNVILTLYMWKKGHGNCSAVWRGVYLEKLSKAQGKSGSSESQFGAAMGYKPPGWLLWIELIHFLLGSIIYSNHYPGNN